MEERQAIAKLKQGDIAGLETLVRKYYLQAVRVAYLILQEQALAEDVAQSSFINLYKKIDQYDDSRDFRPWFFRSVVNKAISVTRKRSRTVSLDDYEEAAGWFSSLNGQHENERSLEDDLISGETRQSIWLALEKLTPRQRAAIVMRYYLELSEKEIAQEMERPKSTVKWTLYSARQKLQQVLRPQLDDEYQPESIQEDDEERL